MVQLQIKKLINQADVILEYPFKNRRADVFWKSKNIVFEVQISPISLKEVIKRSKDFEEIGIHLVWILHQKTFNKKHITPSEEYLLNNKTVFYTNISQSGEGIIFDQEQAISFTTRVLKSPPVEIDICSPIFKGYKKTLYFKNCVKLSPIYKRVKLFTPIWEKKIKIWIFKLKLKRVYYYRYFKWKIKLS
jgi:hypothetical protein